MELINEVEVLTLKEEIEVREQNIQRYNVGLIALWIDQGEALLKLLQEETGFTHPRPSNSLIEGEYKLEVQKCRDLEKILGKQSSLSYGSIQRYMTFALSPLIANADLVRLVNFDQRSLLEMARLPEDDFNEVLNVGNLKEWRTKKKREEEEALVKKMEGVKIDANILFGDSRIHILKAPYNIQCVVTDPPYGMGFQSNRRTASGQERTIKNDENIDVALDVAYTVFSELYERMNDNSSLFCFIGWREECDFRELIEACGFTIKNSIIWNKINHGTGDLKGSFSPKHERIIYAVKGKPELSKRYDDVLDGMDIRTTHPTAKPIDLIKKLIEVTTKVGDIVADPFAGHGSTLIAAKEMKRNIWGCELEEYNYAEIKRWLNE